MADLDHSAVTNLATIFKLGAEHALCLREAVVNGTLPQKQAALLRHLRYHAADIVQMLESLPALPVIEVEVRPLTDPEVEALLLDGVFGAGMAMLGAQRQPTKPNLHVVRNDGSAVR